MIGKYIAIEATIVGVCLSIGFVTGFCASLL